jgi:hypothetical protein
MFPKCQLGVALHVLNHVLHPYRCKETSIIKFFKYMRADMKHQWIFYAGSCHSRRSQSRSMKNCLLNFFFLHKSQNMSVFHQTWCAHIACRYVSEKNFVCNFWHLKIFFSVTEVHAPMSRIEFPR